MPLTQRWKIFIALALTFVIGIFFRVSMAVISMDLARDLQLNAAQLGIISGVFFYVFAFAQIPLGPVLDRFGGRWTMTALGVVTASGSLVFALATDYYSAAAGRVILGLGTASVLMGSLKILTGWFNAKEFAKISGFLVAIGNLGSIAATLPLASAIKNIGWRSTFIATAVLQIAFTALVFIIARDAPELKSTETSHSSRKDVNRFLAWKLLFSTPAFWLVSLVAFFWYANYMVLLGLWGGPYLMEVVGLSRSESSKILLCTSVGYICGSFSFGKIVDFLGGSLLKTAIIGQSLLLLTMTAMLGPAEYISKALLAFIFLSLGFVSASGLTIYHLSRNLLPLQYAATAMTCVNFSLLMGVATVQHIMGLYIHSFSRGATGYPAVAYHSAFLIPISGLAVTIVLLVYYRKIL